MKLLLTLLFALLSFTYALPGGSNGQPATIRVQPGPGTPIQSAISSSKAGDRIIVSEGTYAEQLLITTPGLTLIGSGKVILTPPAVPVTNLCTGLAGKVPPAYTIDTQAGICIAGQGVVLADSSEHRKVSSVVTKVQGVEVYGFTIQGFLGLNIAVVGGQDTQIHDNVLTDGAFYGALTVGSANTIIRDNIVNSSPPTPANTYLPFIGVCMDDVSTVEIKNNGISGYLIGLCVQTNGANIHDNRVSSCCIGAFIDPGIVRARLKDNSFKDTNPRCFNSATSGSFLISGIYIAGAKDTRVKDNKVTGITTGGNTSLGGVGIAVTDDFPPPSGTGAVASGNRVKDNVVKRNDLDILVAATGQGNVVKDNDCGSSSPAGLCN